VNDYILGSDAVLDLEDVVEYIAAHNVDAADRWIAKLFDAFEAIAGMPGIGHSRTDLTAFPVLFTWRNTKDVGSYLGDCGRIVVSARLGISFLLPYDGVGGAYKLAFPFMESPTNSLLPAGYEEFLRDLKQRIRAAQVRAAVAVNRELILLYWHVGREILERQDRAGWGAKVIERLAADLHSEFPDMKGFSRTNLLYMRAFAEAWPEESFVQQVVGQIPWGHNLRILDMVKDPGQREWYLRAAVQHGWSRNVLVHQIESGLHRRQGRAHTNFTQTLPPPQSDLAQQVLKDPYNFDFLTLADDAREKELKSGLLEHLPA